MDFFPETLPLWATSFKDVATGLALVVGGLWAARKYRFLREDSPRVNFSVDCEFTGKHEGSWVVSFVAHVENVGDVPHRIKGLEFDVRCLLSGDQLKQGPARIGGQLDVPHRKASGSWRPAEGKDTMILMPAVKLTYRYVYWLPSDVRFVLIHGRMSYPRFDDYHRADNLVAAPPSEQRLPKDDFGV